MFIDKLKGKHILSGISTYPDADGYVLIIDGDVYAFYEDDEDKYRSECIIRKLDKMPETVYVIQNEEVFIEVSNYREKNNFEGGTYNGLYDDRAYIENFKILNILDKSIIFHAYTADWGLYYPCCQFEYYPEKLQLNKKLYDIK